MTTENKQGMPPRGQQADNSFLGYDSDMVASATECTGLIPTPPLSEQEAESYTDIFAIPKPENEGNNLQGKAVHPGAVQPAEQAEGTNGRNA